MIFEKDVPIAIRTRILQILSEIGKIRGTNATPAHLNIFGRVDGNDYIKYLLSRIKVIGFDKNPKFSGMIARIDINQTDRLLFTNQILTHKLSEIYILDILFHEARHTEDAEDNWLHIKCPQKNVVGEIIVGELNNKPLEGQYACDNYAYGAYGSTAILLFNISKFCVTCSPQTRAEAAKVGFLSLKRVINLDAYMAIKKDLGL